MTREPGDLPALVTLPACGARDRGGFRSGDMQTVAEVRSVTPFPFHRHA